MNPTVSIPSLHLEYSLWINELNFFKEEIQIFERHLEHLINIFEHTEAKAKIEQFQNQFICQKEVIDVLKHDLYVSERQLASFVRELSGSGMESVKMDNHVNLRERVKTFRRIFNDLRNEFRQFEMDWT
ncbi:MAG: hypothetical protein ACM3VS_11840 [Candidatus Dadabacteria bacterium]